MRTRQSLPTFLVIGAQKCGTTWLAEMVRQHPEVGVSPIKELHFFDSPENFARGLDWYRRQFKVSRRAKAVGEFTPNYLWTAGDPGEIAPSWRIDKVPEAVHEALPDVQLIVCLRDPVERAISAYHHHFRWGWVAPGQGLSEVVHRFGITSMGRYDIHLMNWFKYYSRERFLILVYEEDLLDENKSSTLRRVFAHLGVDDQFSPGQVYERYNAGPSAVPRRRATARSDVPAPSPDIAASGPLPVTPAERRYLEDIFRPHNLALRALLGRELPW